MPAKRNRKQKQSVPEEFASPQAAGEFWDRHDLADSWHQTRPVQGFHFRIESTKYLLAVEPSLVRKLRKIARRRGISCEALANLWLREKVENAASRS